MNDYIDDLGVEYIDAIIPPGTTDDGEELTDEIIVENVKLGAHAVAAKVLTDLCAAFGNYRSPAHDAMSRDLVMEWAESKGITLQPTSPVDKV